MADKNYPPIYFHYVMEDSISDFYDDFPGDWDLDDAPSMHEVLEGLLPDHIYDAIDRLSTIVVKRPIDSICLSIDHLGEYDVTANQMPHHSDKGNHFTIGLNPGILRHLLDNHWHPNVELSFSGLLTLDHEIVHGLDNIFDRFRSHFHGPTIQQIDELFQFLLGYRMEGVASFTTFLRCIRGERSYRKAKKILNSTFERVTKQLEKKEPALAPLADLFKRTTFQHYSLGPMMLLHAIYVEARMNANESIIQLVLRAVQSEKLTDHEINHLIDQALDLDLPTFYKNLSMPSWEETPFLEGRKLTEMIQLAREVKYPVTYGNDSFAELEEFRDQMMREHEECQRTETDELILLSAAHNVKLANGWIESRDLINAEMQKIEELLQFE